MWLIKILNGSQSGQTFNLSSGKTLLGRSSECQIVLQSSNVSKKHAEIEVDAHGRVHVTDLNSSNGTTVNGVRVQNRLLRAKDKISFDDVICEVVQLSKFQASQNMPQPAKETLVHQEEESPLPKEKKNLFSEVLDRFDNYLNQTVLSGVYKLTEWFHFNWVLACFVGGYVVLVTALSFVPLSRILKTGAESQGEKVALSVAKSLKKVNAPILEKGADIHLDVRFALAQHGISGAYIISSRNGSIMAPISKEGRFPKESFVHSARKEDRQVVGTSGKKSYALIPIKFYDSQSEDYVTRAFAVAVYDLEALAVDIKKILSLFVQTLTISLFFGFILFYFLFKLMEYPYLMMNRKLNESSSNEMGTLEIPFKFQPLQEIVSHINSFLSKLRTSSEGQMKIQEIDRSNERRGLIQLLGFPALIITAHDNCVSEVSDDLEEATGIPRGEILGCSVDDINDQSFKLSLKELLEKLEQNPHELAFKTLPFSGVDHDIYGHCVYGAEEPSYYLFVLSASSGEDSGDPQENEEGVS